MDTEEYLKQTCREPAHGEDAEAIRSAFTLENDDLYDTNDSNLFIDKKLNEYLVFDKDFFFKGIVVYVSFFEDASAISINTYNDYVILKSVKF